MQKVYQTVIKRIEKEYKDADNHYNCPIVISYSEVLRNNVEELKRDDIDVIYNAGDSGREGEYIYRLVEQMAGVKGKVRKEVDRLQEATFTTALREALDK